MISILKIKKDWRFVGFIVLATIFITPCLSHSKTADKIILKEAEKALKIITEAIKILEQYENNDDNKDTDEANIVKKLQTLTDEARKAINKAQKLAKNGYNKRLLGDADVRLEWAQHILSNGALKKRASLMGYFYQAQIKIFIGYNCRKN